MKKYRVEFNTCKGYNHNTVDYMYVFEPVFSSDDWELAHLFAEVKVEKENLDENGNETVESKKRHYNQLVEEVTLLAARLGISREQLIFDHDNLKEETTMEKKIRFIMTNEKYYEYTGKNSTGDLAIDFIPVDLNALSPAARFVAEHITATRIVDEYIDHIDVKAIAEFSMAERDKCNGKSDEYIAKMTSMYGDSYTRRMEETISFPVLGKKYNTPCAVIKEAVKQFRKNGAEKLVAGDGTVFVL